MCVCVCLDASDDELYMIHITMHNILLHPMFLQTLLLDCCVVVGQYPYVGA